MNLNVDQENDHTYVIRSADQELTRLHINEFEKFLRPYLFPVFTPSGKNITRHYPMEEIEGETHDHPHHTGVYSAWGDINGVDNWAVGPNKGKQIVRSINYETTDAGVIFTLEIDWTTADEKPQLAETRTIQIYDPTTFTLPPESSPAFVYDFTVAFHAKYGPVKFGDTKEGGLLSVRVATPLNVESEKGGQIVNSRGGKSASKKDGKKMYGENGQNGVIILES